MRGSVRKRCSCPAELDARGRRKACTIKHGSWGYTVDLGPGLSPDGVHLERRQVTRFGFPTKKDAEKALAEVLDANARGLAIAVNNVTVAAFLNDWLAGRIADGLRPTTAATYTAHFNNYFIPRIGHLRLRELRPQHVEAALRSIQTDRTMKPASLRRVHASLRSALGAAVRLRLIPNNPAVGVSLPSVTRPHVRPWEPEELGRFLDHADRDDLGAIFHLLAATGLRRGEAVGLRWSDVDLDKSRLHVRQQVVTLTAKFSRPCDQCGGDHGRIGFGRPKTASGEDRVVDLDPLTVGVLLAHRLRQDVLRAQLGDAYNDHDLVFPRPDGVPLHPDRVSDRFTELAAEIGLRRVRLHDLRHGQASLMLAAGVDIVVVSKRLGHSSVAITSDTYTHLLPGVGSEAAARAWSLVPRSTDASQRVREQSVSNSPSDEDHEEDTEGIVAGPRPEDGAAYRNRTDDLRITSASL
jgi:integrase